MTHSEREHTPQRIYGREEEIGKERQSGLCHVRVFSVFLSCHSFFLLAFGRVRQILRVFRCYRSTIVRACDALIESLASHSSMGIHSLVINISCYRRLAIYL